MPSAARDKLRPLVSLVMYLGVGPFKIQTNFMRKETTVHGPFVENDALRVGHSSLTSCLTEVPAKSCSKDSYVVEAQPCECGNLGCDLLCQTCPVYRAYGSIGGSLICCSAGSGKPQVISIGNCVHEVREKCFENDRSLECVIFCAASKLERICIGAFSCTSIESVTIPDNVVELGEQCFHECRRLSRVTFGVSSKLERICAKAFACTAIESLNIPDSVV